MPFTIISIISTIKRPHREIHPKVWCNRTYQKFGTKPCSVFNSPVPYHYQSHRLSTTPPLSLVSTAACWPSLQNNISWSGQNKPASAAVTLWPALVQPTSSAYPQNLQLLLLAVAWIVLHYFGSGNKNDISGYTSKVETYSLSMNPKPQGVAIFLAVDKSQHSSKLSPITAHNQTWTLQCSTNQSSHYTYYLIKLVQVINFITFSTVCIPIKIICQNYVIGKTSNGVITTYINPLLGTLA